MPASSAPLAGAGDEDSRAGLWSEGKSCRGAERGERGVGEQDVVEPA